MLIGKPRARKWRRDPGLEDLIAYFNLPERREHPERITSPEWAAIEEQIEKCAADFVYASRNYFYIIDKQRKDRLFSLWESQELILEEIMALKEKHRAQRLYVLKARQVGASTLIEALIAWRTMFFPNTYALVVSEPSNILDLFNIMLRIYDNMPWWLRPKMASRKQEEGLLFANDDLKSRDINPGLNSVVTVQSSAQRAGIGQGVTINAAHISELPSWVEEIAKEAIEADIGPALADNEETFCIIEGTGKGAGRYAHKLWKHNVERGEMARFKPIFIPCFMESTRVLAPPQGWRPQPQEIAVRDRVKDSWVRCDNQECLMWRESIDGTVSVVDTVCPACGAGTLRSYVMTNEQLCWMWDLRLQGEHDITIKKKLQQEFAVTAEEAFQISGYQVFPEDVREYAKNCVRRPFAMGDFDTVTGAFHGIREVIRDARGEIVNTRCYVPTCDDDHRYSWAYTGHAKPPLQIWEFPEDRNEYAVGVDVSEGIGEDYSVAWVNRIGKFGGPDVQVAMYRANWINPYDFAYFVNRLGRWYNDALMSIEWQGYQACAMRVDKFFQYPNLFQWKHYDSKNMISNKKHWMTQFNTKPLLWQTAVKFLRSRMWVPQAEEFAEEIITFQKEDYADRSGSAMSGFYDDVAMASTICLFTSHDMDFDEGTNEVRVPNRDVGEVSGATHIMQCSRHKEHTWEAVNPERESACPECVKIYGGRNACRILKAISAASPSGNGTAGDSLFDMLNEGDNKAEDYEMATYNEQ